MKYVDLELEEPITKEMYQVQVKARADVAAFNASVDQFAGGVFRKLYFVVHSPTAALEATQSDGGDVELVPPERLAGMVVDHGLVSWVLSRVQ
jgi:hypothetical protein